MMSQLLRLCALVFITAAAYGEVTPKAAEESAHVAHLVVNGAIGPATTDYLTTAMQEAHEQGAQAVVVEMNTPGGLDAATRDIVQAFLASPIPIITYVHPAGSRAASAGTYILYASHVAAMTPATTLGAATPVDMSGGNQDSTPMQRPPSSESANGDADNGDAEMDEEQQRSPESSSAMERKVVNDAVAFIRALAQRHGRNAEWAERAVRDAVSLTASEALAENVIDILATDLDDLLKQAHGREVQMQQGPTVLQLEGLPVKRYEPNWRNELLALITNPQIAYILLMVGVYGLILEGYSPGAMVPGVVGVISLLVALYALQLLPISYAGLALIIVGAALIAAEAFAPSFGVLGLGGVTALVFGSVMLVDTEVPGMMIPIELIAAIGAATSLLLLAVLIFAGRSLRLPRTRASKDMIGRTARVANIDGNHYQVHVFGELWRAQCPLSLEQGQTVRIIEQHGLTLTVEPENSSEVNV